MRLIGELERRLAAEASLFHAQLLREDIARLEKMRELAHRTANLAAFKRAVLQLGWTREDARTREIAAPLEALAEALYAREKGEGEGDLLEARVIEAWAELHRVRMERLVGCLAAPLPKPDDL
jgi:hypothetical protein